MGSGSQVVKPTISDANRFRAHAYYGHILNLGAKATDQALVSVIDSIMDTANSISHYSTWQPMGIHKWLGRCVSGHIRDHCLTACHRAVLLALTDSGDCHTSVWRCFNASVNEHVLSPVVARELGDQAQI
ncbi:hypothetical protein J6590_032787 [Homalodisca vitripennis]|nr:hypothetical protein J6590_032787 [Homalodisca vitripennis]